MFEALNELRDAACFNAKEKGFTDINVGSQLMLIVTEVAEAMEDHRKGLKPDQFLYALKDGRVCNESEMFFTANGTIRNEGGVYKPVGIPSEVADVMIRCLDFCGRFDIDISRAVEEKMTYNKTRNFKHGKTL